MSQPPKDTPPCPPSRMDIALLAGARILVGLSLPWAMMYGAVYLFTVLVGSGDPHWHVLGPVSAVGLVVCLVQCLAVASFFARRASSRWRIAAGAGVLAILSGPAVAVAFGKPMGGIEIGNLAFHLLVLASMLPPTVGRWLNRQASG